MTLDEILTIAQNHTTLLGIGIAILLSLVEISKIHINPWSAILKWIGNLVFGGIREDISELRDDIKELRIDQENTKKIVTESMAMSSRYRIIRFADEITNGIIHSFDHYKQIIADIKIYKQFCLDHPDFVNGEGQTAMDIVQVNYEKRLASNDFLVESKDDGESFKVVNG